MFDVSDEEDEEMDQIDKMDKIARDDNERHNRKCMSTQLAPVVQKKREPRCNRSWSSLSWPSGWWRVWLHDTCI